MDQWFAIPTDTRRSRTWFMAVRGQEAQVSVWPLRIIHSSRQVDSISPWPWPVNIGRTDRFHVLIE